MSVVAGRDRSARNPTLEILELTDNAARRFSE